MSEREQKSGGVGCFIAAVLLLLSVLYVLSSGPALGLHWRGYLPAKFLTIYAPLQSASQLSQPVCDFLTWYKNLFRPEPRLH